MVDGPVAAENDDCVSLFDQRCPPHIGGTLEFKEGLRHVPRPKNRSGAHARVLKHREQQGNRCFLITESACVPKREVGHIVVQRPLSVPEVYKQTRGRSTMQRMTGANSNEPA